MKTYVNYFLCASLLVTVTACNYGVGHEDDMVGTDSISWGADYLDVSLNESDSLADDYIFDEVLIVDKTIDLESFQNQFSVYFDHKFDFAWRYIASNYTEYLEDASLEHTTTNFIFDMQKVNAVSVEGDAYPIEFVGFAHSYQYVNGGHIYVTYDYSETREELKYYYVNAAFEVLQKGILAYRGEDKEAWSYGYGEFSKDFSIYEMYHVSGEGKDTTNYTSEFFYFE
ncbi:MAG: hypothetical protein ACI8ZM_000589 [Crocinitomix sp.]|jgi:hypothetical protein